MTDLKMLGLYLGIAIVVAILFNGAQGFRRLLGSRDLGEKMPRRKRDERYVDIIARSGTGVAADKLFARTGFRSTWGMRLVGLFLSSCVLFMLVRSVYWDMSVGSTGADAFWILVPVAIWIWYNFYIFTYEVIIFDGTLINSTWYLSRQRFELRKLKHVEQDMSGFYRLEFTGGGIAHVLKYVQGHETLYNALNTALDQEPYDPCPSFPR